MLVLPRRHADALLPEGPLQVPAGGVPVRAAARREPPARPRPSRSTSCSTPASSTTAATSTCSSSTRRPSPEDILVEITVFNRGPGGGDARPAPDDLVPQHLVLGRLARGRASPRTARRDASSSRIPEYGRRYAPLPSRMPSCCSPRTTRTPSACSRPPNASPYVKDAFHAYLIGGRRDAVHPDAPRHEGGGLDSGSRCPPEAKPAMRLRCRPRRTRRRATRSARSFDVAIERARAARPTSSTRRSVISESSRRTSGGSCGRPSPA